MIQTQVINRVFYLEYSNEYHTRQGTCFSMCENDKEYLVTAHHLVSGYSDEDYLKVGFKEVGPRLLLVDEKNDIAIFDAPEHTKYPDLPLKVTMEGIVLGQSVMWMGYPLGYDGGMLFEGSPEHGYVALVGSGTLASLEIPSILRKEKKMGLL